MMDDPQKNLFVSLGEPKYNEACHGNSMILGLVPFIMSGLKLAGGTPHSATQIMFGNYISQ